LQLTGKGIEKKIRYEPTAIDFGVVGIDHAEKRTMEVVNTSLLPFIVSIQSSDPKFRAVPEYA
jgi:hypothetical protein